MTQPEVCSFLPRDADGAPIFTEPWQAKAFALTVHLHDKGAFTWTEWSAALARHSTGSVPYFQAWVRALEYLLADRDLAEPARVESVTDAWHRAAEATPHGQPILLENGQLGG